MAGNADEDVSSNQDDYRASVSNSDSCVTHRVPQMLVSGLQWLRPTTHLNLYENRQVLSPLRSEFVVFQQISSLYQSLIIIIIIMILFLKRFSMLNMLNCAVQCQ